MLPSCFVAGSHGDVEKLLPQLLDQLAALGDLAKQISFALGNNGHRAGEVQTILEGIRRQDK